MHVFVPVYACILGSYVCMYCFCHMHAQDWNPLTAFVHPEVYFRVATLPFELATRP